MNKTTLSLICISIFLSFSSCSSVKVLDSWKNDRITNIKDNNFLVVARANNPQARIAFENEIVSQMESNGYQATASFSKFGNMKPNEPKSETNKEKLQEILKLEGFNAVILTVMKDYQEETRLEKEGGYYAGGNYYGYYPRYYGGFYPYFYNPLSYHTLGNYVEESYSTSTSKLYILETTIYNLDESGENQLVAVITSKIDNPQTASGAAKEYVKEISKKLK
ncbi:hypothetical protein GCM10023311_06460 [Flaviramulus aquimarinus]|uniref:DUF4136 domain-containing protein n=1 Tax=Flaviramulus aquimarinus TaxID=1170456 RepID=A0ABP9ET03_9FLAO